MLANRTSRWSIGTALLCALLLVATWFLLISPRRADATALRAETVSAEDQAAQLQNEIAQLKIQFADLPKREAELVAIKKQLPAKAEMPALVRELQGIAANSGVALDSIAPGSPSILSAAAAPAAGTAASATGSVVTVPVTLGVTGDYFETALFVKQLQTKVTRAFLITGVTAASAPETATQTDPATVPVTTGTATPVPTATATTTSNSTENPLARTTLTLTGSVFVLMDDTTTLADVAKDVKASTATGASTPAPVATTSTGTPN